MCQFTEDQAANAAVVVVRGTYSDDQGHHQLVCNTEALNGISTLRATMNGQQYGRSYGSKFETYERPTVTSMSSVDSEAAVRPLVSVSISSVEPVILEGIIASSTTAAVRLWPLNRDEGDWHEFSGLQVIGNRLSFGVEEGVYDPLLNAGADTRIMISLNGQQYDFTGKVLSLYNPATPAVLESVRPASGSKEGETVVKLTGSNLAGRATLKCKFATPTSTQETAATFQSSQMATCETPANYDTGSTTVTVPGEAGVTMTNDGSLWSVDQESFRYTETSPTHCTAQGPGIEPAALQAGDWATFAIAAKNALGDSRTNGGDQFYVQVTSRYHTSMDANEEVTGFAVDLDQEYEDPSAWPASINEATIRSLQYVAVAGTEIQSVNAGKYFALYNVTRSGVYYVMVTSGGLNVSGSPFAVEVQPGEFVAQNSLVEGKETTLNGNSTAGELVEFELHFRDRFGNPVSEALTSTVDARMAGSGDLEDVLLDVVAISSSINTRTLRAMITVAGSYELNCRVNNFSAVGSGLAFTVHPATASEVMSAHQLNATLDILADNAWTSLFTLVVRDEFGNRRFNGDNIDVTAVHTKDTKRDGTPFPANARAEQMASELSAYVVQVQAPKAGTYNLTTRLNGLPMPIENATMLVRPGSLAVAKDAAASTFKGTNVSRNVGTVGAGVTDSLQVDGRDEFGNLRDVSDGTYEVRFKPATRRENKQTTYDEREWPLDGYRFFSTPTAVAPGTHTVSFNITVSGYYDVYVYHSGELLTLSPAVFGEDFDSDDEILKVEPAESDPAQSVVAPDPGKVAGQTARCEVRLKDRFGNPRNVDGSQNEQQLVAVSIESADMPTFWQDNADLCARFFFSLVLMFFTC